MAKCTSAKASGHMIVACLCDVRCAALQLRLRSQGLEDPEAAQGLLAQLPGLLSFLAAAAEGGRSGGPPGCVLVAAAAGHDGDAAVVAIAHVMRARRVSCYEALLLASRRRAALQLKVRVRSCTPWVKDESRELGLMLRNAAGLLLLSASRHRCTQQEAHLENPPYLTAASISFVVYVIALPPLQPDDADLVDVIRARDAGAAPRHPQSLGRQNREPNLISGRS